MLCEEIENRILDYQGNQMSPAQREEVEIHLAGCDSCRIFARQLQQLDAALLASVKIPSISANFDQRLQERIQCAPIILTEVQRAERKRQLQAEFDAGVARIGRGAFALGSLMSHLMRAILAAAASWLAWHFTAQLTAHFYTQSLGGLISTLLPWLAASTVFLVIGVTEAFPRRCKFLQVW